MDLSNLFDQFNTQESYAILFILIIAFLLGFWAGRLSRSGRIKRLRKELEAKTRELTETQLELNSLREQLDLKEADLKKAGLELEELRVRVDRLEGEKTKLYNEIYALNADLEKHQIASKTYTSTIDDLNNQLWELQAQNEKLSHEVSSEEAIPAVREEMESIIQLTRDRLELVENKLEKLEAENKSLKVELSSLKDSGVLELSFEPAPVTTSSMEETEVLTVDPVVRINQEKSVLKEKILVEEKPEKDDLTRIKGIGPFIEKKLNEIGIFTYQQISQFDAAKIEQVTTDIDFFPGRIERDDWVGQAKELLQQKVEHPESFVPQQDSSHDRSDLRVVEGIGPKIEQILKEAGIKTWDDLAVADAARLKEILESAGGQFRMHDPGTWPAQALLAARGKWGELKAYQDELQRGREVD